MAFLAPLAAPLLEGVGAEAAGGIAGGAAAEGGGGLLGGGLGGFMGDHPFLMGNLMGRAMSGGGPAGAAQMGPSADASVAEPMVGVTGKVGADMFGEDEVGMATQNRGENSDPDEASSTGIEGEAEHGDSPEQNKDTDLGIGDDANSKSPFAEDDLKNQGGADGDLRDTATNAFHSNLPLVLEFAFSDQSGQDHPILKALDELLESAFPGYKDVDPMLAEMGGDTTETGVGPHDPENPTEKLEGELGQDLDEDGPADEPEKDEKTAGVNYDHNPDDPRCQQCFFGRDDLQPVPMKGGGEAYLCRNCRRPGPYNSGGAPIGHPSGHQFGQDIGGSDSNYTQPWMPRGAATIAREAGYCPECWGVLDVLGRCASTHHAADVPPAPWPVGSRVRHVDEVPRPENYATIKRVKKTPYGYSYDLVDPQFGEEVPDVPHNSDLVYVDAGKPAPNRMPPTTYGDGRPVFDRFPSIQPGDAEHFSYVKEADVPGPPSSSAMGYAADTSMQTNITGVPTCPLCHQNHVAGTPCPTPQMQAPAATNPVSPTATNFAVPMQNNKVVTKYQVVAADFDDDWQGDPHGALQRQLQNDKDMGASRDDHESYLSELMDVIQEYGLTREDVEHAADQIWGPRVAKTAEYDADEIDREPADPMHNESYEDGETPDVGWYEDWQGPDKDDEKHPWVDDSGKPLEEGQEYEMHSTGYAVPDKIKVLAVTPNKLTYELEAGDLAYKDTLTTDDVYKQGYTFKPSTGDDDPGMETQQPPQRQPLELAHPKPPRPGDDALPQQDDISSPPTRVSHEKESGQFADWMNWEGIGPAAQELGSAVRNMPRDIKDTIRDMAGRSPGADESNDGEGPVCPICMRSDPSVAEFGKCIHCKQNDDMEEGGHAYLGAIKTAGDNCEQCGAHHPDEGYDWECKDCGHLNTRSYDPGTGEPHTPEDAFTDEDEQHYFGSFRGDDPDSRGWLNEPGPGQGIDIDPATMAKVAGKDFSAREQRQFIDEQGTARNLHRLDLEGTHYELDDYGDSLW